MAVPNTDSGWSLDTVRAELGLATNTSLTACVAAGNSQGGWDATYSGSKNSLLNFRNYGAVPPLTAFQASSYSINDGNNQCNQPYSIMRWHNGTGQGPSIGDTVYWSDGGGNTDSNVFRKYIPSNFVEVPRTYGTDSNGVVNYLVICPF